MASKAPKSKFYSGRSYTARVALAVLQHGPLKRAAMSHVLDTMGVKPTRDQAFALSSNAAADLRQQQRRKTKKYKVERSQRKRRRSGLVVKDEGADKATGLGYSTGTASDEKGAALAQAAAEADAADIAAPSAKRRKLAPAATKFVAAAKAVRKNAAKQRQPRRRMDEIPPSQRWHCPQGCGQEYCASATPSIKSHNRSCQRKQAQV